MMKNIKLPKELIVIGEVPVNTAGQINRRSMREFLKSYSRYFNIVHYIGPGPNNCTRIRNEDKIICSTVPYYGKPIQKRLHYLLHIRQAQRRFATLFKTHNDPLVQIRLPAIFPLVAFPVVKRLNLSLTTDIAGNWKSAFVANYNFFGNHLIAEFLDSLQRRLIKYSIPVAKGNVLAKMYSNLAPCHVYYATTHNRLHKREFKFPVSHLIFVGRLEPCKRVEDLIDAVSMLVYQYELKYVNLTIIGDGKMRPALERKVQKLNLINHVSFLGEINDKKILQNQYMKANILVLPSISEGTPNVLPEAMAHGVIPIAVIDVGSNNNIIKNGHNGFLIHKKNPNEIAQHILRLRKNPALVKKIVEAGYSYASKHTLDCEVDKMWEFVSVELARKYQES